MKWHSSTFTNHSKRNTVKPQQLKHWWLINHGWFTLVFDSLWNSLDHSKKQIIKEIFLFYHNTMESAHCSHGSFLWHSICSNSPKLLLYSKQHIEDLNSGGTRQILRVRKVSTEAEWKCWNSIDPDQMHQNTASDHGLHCLPHIQQFRTHLLVIKYSNFSTSMVGVWKYLLSFRHLLERRFCLAF